MNEIVSKPIELGHPVDISFSDRALSRRQQIVLDRLPEYGSGGTFKKREVSMLDLAALTAKTGAEFAMFTCQGNRLIVRGDCERIPINLAKAAELHALGFRWSGHTHPGFSDASLIASDGDKRILKVFEQDRSAIYNAAGKYVLITL